MNKLRLATAAALVCGLFAGSASAASVESTNDWWSVDFQSPTATGVALVEGQLGNLTNNAATAEVVQPYNSGVWTALEGDESVITNGIVTNAVANTSATSTYLKLDTQGNDLTWAPTNTSTGVTISKALVDADLLLVGSDSAPATDDFDKNGDVQTAIYLKNEIDEDNGETTNSVLCVYVSDATSTDVDSSIWVELKNAANPELTDNSWHHIAVFVEYPTAASARPQVSVVVDETLMKDATGETHWTIANVGSFGDAATRKLTSVSLRGTGAVDNFTGKAITSTDIEYAFAADVYLDGVFQPEMSQTNRTAAATTEFPGFPISDFAEHEGIAEWALSKIVLIDGTGARTEYEFDYDNSGTSMTPLQPKTTLPASIVIGTEDYEGEPVQTGVFSVTPSTVGATEDCTLVEIYYLTIGAHNANAVTVVGGTSTTEPTVVKPSDFAEGATKTLTWTFNATEGANVLRTVAVQNGATATYANGVATVTVTLSAMIAADTTYVTATYVEGDYTGKTPQWIDNGDGTYTLAAGVAKIGTTIYDTLADAVAAVPTDGTQTKIELIADITVPEGTAMFQTIGANRNVYLDFGGHVIDATAQTSQGLVFRVQGTALFTNGTIRATGWVAGVMATKASHQGSLTIADGTYVSTGADAIQLAGVTTDEFAGSLTIAGGSVEAARFAVAYTEAGASVTVTGGTLTSHAAAAISGSGTAGYAGNTVTVTGGKLVADGVGLSAGNSTCGIYCPNADTVVFGGEAEIESTGAGIVACAGSVTVSGGTITTTGTAAGTVASNPDELPPAALVFDTKAGYPGYAAAAKIAVSGGTFVSAVNPVQQVAAEGDATAIEITGGWFSAEPAAAYVATGLTAVQDAANAPNENATWTVKAAAVQIDGETGTYLSIAAAKAAAAEAQIADPVFVIVGELSEETVTLAYGDTLKIKVAENGDATALSVETSETGDDQYTYEVVNETDAETGVTTYSVTRTVKTYAVTFTVDGTTVATTNAPYGDTLYGPADPTKTAETGYTVAFAGWTNAVAGGAVVAAANLPAVTGEATWAAVFTTTAIEYTVTVALDGGTLASGDSIPETYTVETAAFNLPTPTKEGFTFKGWVDGDNQPVTQIAGGATGDISLTATWEEESGEVEVNPGDGLAQYKTDHPDATVPEPIEFTSGATPLCKIAFVAPATGKYVLMTSTTVNGTYQAEGTPTAYEAGALVQLTETASATTKFFKIGYEK